MNVVNHETYTFTITNCDTYYLNSSTELLYFYLKDLTWETDFWNNIKQKMKMLLMIIYACIAVVIINIYLILQKHLSWNKWSLREYWLKPIFLLHILQTYQSNGDLKLRNHGILGNTFTFTSFSHTITDEHTATQHSTIHTTLRFN